MNGRQFAEDIPESNKKAGNPSWGGRFFTAVRGWTTLPAHRTTFRPSNTDLDGIGENPAGAPQFFIFLSWAGGFLRFG